MKSRKIAVGLSGGVDSAVAAAILKEEGHQVIGLTMKIWSGAVKVAASTKQACFGPDEAEDIAVCEALARKLGIEYQVFDLSREYEARVLDYFRAEYLRGRTPNPCIVCNRELKFGFLLERARASGLDFELFATGHYARIAESGGIRRLGVAADASKDQSYFLYRLPSELLEKVRFPLGELTKPQVRDLARGLGLEVADKPESQDFIAGGDYSPLFADRPPEPGDIVDESGTRLGRHRGLPYYTIGQRRGIGVSTGSEPLYVLRIDAAANTVVVGPGRGLFSESVQVEDFRLQDPRDGAREISAFAKIRQNHLPVGCVARPAGGGACRVDFEVAQRAVAPGQSLVLYDGGGWVIGGGVIEK